jgi:hypothetical protein
VKGLLVARFVAVVELFADALAQLVDHRPGIERRIEHRHHAIEDGDVLQVSADGLVDTRVLDLDDDLGAVGELRAMHLADRRRGQWFLVEAREGALERFAQLALGDVAQEREVHGRRRRLERLQRCAVLRRHRVGHERHHLAELHHGALHLAHRAGHRDRGGFATLLIESCAPRLAGEESPHARAHPARRESRRQATEARHPSEAASRDAARVSEQQEGRERDGQRDQRDQENSWHGGWMLDL